MVTCMSNKDKVVLWSSPETGITSSPYAEWDGFKYFTDCDMFKISVSLGQHTPYTGELKIIEEYTKDTGRNRNCVDVGAHIGTHTLPLSGLFGHVNSFEATNRNFQYLQKNIKANNIKNVTCHEYALGSKCGFVSMSELGDHNSGQYGVKEDSDGDVRLERLDSFGLVDIDFIKVDVEGYESEVLEGAKDTIRTYRPMIQVEANSNKHKDVALFLKNEGYAVYQKIHEDVFYV
jgi:FkbM family methyltransferase